MSADEPKYDRGTRVMATQMASGYEPPSMSLNAGAAVGLTDDVNPLPATVRAALADMSPLGGIVTTAAVNPEPAAALTRDGQCAVLERLERLRPPRFLAAWDGTTGQVVSVWEYVDGGYRQMGVGGHAET